MLSLPCLTQIQDNFGAEFQKLEFSPLPRPFQGSLGMAAQQGAARCPSVSVPSMTFIYMPVLFLEDTRESIMVST